MCQENSLINKKVDLTLGISIIPTQWREPVFFDCLLKTGRAVSSGGTIDDACKQILKRGIIKTSAIGGLKWSFNL